MPHNFFALTDLNLHTLHHKYLPLGITQRHFNPIPLLQMHFNIIILRIRT